MKATNRKNPATGRYAITHGALSFLGRRYVSPGLLDRLRGKEIDIYYDRRDLSVIYLFLHGELVGEAYCPEFLGRRVSSWEAQAERQAETAQAKEATDESRVNRQRIQQTALQGRRVLALERKRLERRRLWDQQRQEIHPARVEAVLQGLTRHAQQAAPQASAPRSLLPPAEPEDDPVGTPVNHLPIRPRGAPDA